MIIICSNDVNNGVTEHQSLLTHMDACVDMGDILGTNSCIGMGDMRIYLVGLYNIIF